MTTALIFSLAVAIGVVLTLLIEGRPRRGEWQCRYCGRRWGSKYSYCPRCGFWYA